MDYMAKHFIFFFENHLKNKLLICMKKSQKCWSVNIRISKMWIFSTTVIDCQFVLLSRDERTPVFGIFPCPRFAGMRVSELVSLSVHLCYCQSTIAQMTSPSCYVTLVRNIIYGLYDMFHIIWIILFHVFLKIEFVIPIYLKLTVTARHHYNSSVLFQLICSVHYNNVLL